MADDFGFTEGVKSLSGSLDAAREASKGLSKSIQNVQNDGLEVAQQQARERKLAEKRAALLKERAIYKALEEYKHRKVISEQEYKAKVEFVKKYGTKEWAEVLKIKSDIEELEKKSKKLFDADLDKVRRVQFLCFLAAGWCAYYLVWGVKK
jgi:hypothetical protein